MKFEEIIRLRYQKVSEEQLDALLESEYVVDYDYTTSGKYIDHMVYTLYLKYGGEIEVYYNSKTEEKDHMETKKCLLCDEMVPLSDTMCEDCDYRVKSSYYEF